MSAPSSDPPSSPTSDPPDVAPRIASWLFNGVRAHLIARGEWATFEAMILEEEPTIADWLETASRRTWIAFTPYLEIMRILERELGADGMKTLGEERLRSDLETGALGPMLRAWVREFSHDPSTLMRVSPHVWSAITQSAGAMRLTRAEDREVEFRIAGAPRELLDATGWHRLFEGFGDELMRRSDRQGSVSVRPRFDSGELELSGAWS
ncbi:MAG: hypothetical protein AB7S26_25900 [Sandaracinaceae bacterium]